MKRGESASVSRYGETRLVLLLLLMLLLLLLMVLLLLLRRMAERGRRHGRERANPARAGADVSHVTG